MIVKGDRVRTNVRYFEDAGAIVEGTVERVYERRSRWGRTAMARVRWDDGKICSMEIVSLSGSEDPEPEEQWQRAGEAAAVSEQAAAQVWSESLPDDGLPF